MGGIITQELKDDQTDIYLVDQKLKKLPFYVPSTHQVKILYLSGNYLQVLPNHLLNVVTVFLSNNGYINEVPEKVIQALKSYKMLTRLDLSQNKLKKLNLSHTNIQALILAQNSFESVPDLSKFSGLQELVMDFNFIKELYFETQSLISLTCSLSSVETISPKINAPKITNLDLSKNRITSLPKTFAEKCPSLKALNLDDNQITEINVQLPKTLADFSINSNQLVSISEKVTSLESLRTLYVSKNKIESIPILPNSISKFLGDNNKISSFSNQKYPNLQSLYLSHNNLSEIPTSEMKGDSIIIDHNLIKEIPLSCLTANLRILDVSFNNITKLPAELFSTGNIVKLIANFNEISEIPPEITNSKLLMLSIAHNPIKLIPKLPVSIERISAPYCQIDSLEQNVFENCTMIKLIDFSGNNISEFPFVINGLNYLYLSQNKLTSLPAITESLRVLDVSENNISQIPEKIDGPDLTVLNLAQNSIKSVPTFEKSSYLEYLKLSNNPFLEINLFDVKDIENLDTLDILNTGIKSVVHSVSLRDLITNNPNVVSEALHFIDLSKNSGYAEMLGFRETMEDSIIVRDDIGLYAVCDGHGGSQTATFISHTFTELFIDKIKENLSTSLSISTKDIAAIIELASKRLRTRHFPDGSTLCLCYIDQINKKILSAHLGDARALVVKANGDARDLTSDHKPTLRTEFEFIHQNHGRVSNDRVDGILAVARAMGDFAIHGVRHDPECNEHVFDESDRYLVICCDGVFDVLSNSDVATIVASAESPDAAAYRIRNIAYGIGSLDNISVIVIDLHNFYNK